MVREIITEHNNYRVTEYEIDITQDMRNRALAFATKIKIDDNQFSRLLPKDLRNHASKNIIKILKLEIQRTYVGKLGEIAFLELLCEKGIHCDTSDMFEIYEGQENTDSFDFITLTGDTVDVKTGFRNNHSRLLINIQQFNNLPKTYYVGVKLNATDVVGDDKLILWDSVETAVIKGYAERKFLNRVAERNFGEGPAKHLKYSQLMPIDRLIALF